MFPNLAAELARKGLKQKELTKILKTSRPATISDKMNGKSPLLWDEALKIKKELFPEHSLEYLFYRE